MECEIVRLDEIATLTPGYAFKSKDFGDYPDKVIKITDVQRDDRSSALTGVNLEPYDCRKLERCLVRKGDYYLAMTGSIGKIGRLTDGVAYLNQRVLGVRPNSQIHRTFLWHVLNSVEFRNHLLTHIDSHSVQANISASSVGSFVFELPDPLAQGRIARVLDMLDRKIEVNQRTNDYLGEITEALFKHEILETIDDSWSRASLLDIANYKNGLAMQKFRPEGADPGLPVLKIKELGQGYCAENAERCRSDIDESVRVHDGDLIFSWSGTLLLDFWADGNAGLNQHLFKVSSEKYEPWFYYLWTNYHMRKFIALAKDRATTMGHIKRSALAESEVYIPDENKMVELGRLFNPLIEEMVSSKIESRKLSKLRDVLLPKLMSGEVDVGMIEVSEWPI